MAPAPRAFPSSTSAASESSSPYARCVLILERAIRDTVDHRWDECSRQRALDVSRAILNGCKVCGFRDCSGILRSLVSLLSLPFEDAMVIRPALREQLDDLMALLEEQRRAVLA